MHVTNTNTHTFLSVYSFWLVWISRSANGVVIVENVLTAVFALEVGIAIVALGFVKGKKSYIQVSAIHVSAVFFSGFLAWKLFTATYFLSLKWI